MRQLRKRLEKAEDRLRPQDDNQVTVEELCRLMWRADRRKYRKRGLEGSYLRVFIPQFEREDAELKARASGVPYDTKECSKKESWHL